MEGEIALLIGLVAVSIPVVAIVGHQIVGPLGKALSRLAERNDRALPAAGEERLAEMEARLQRMERSLTRVVEEHESQKALQAGRVPGEGARPAPLSTPDSPEGP